MKKIAYIGSHSSAKTTTVRRIGRLLDDLGWTKVIVIPEVARFCPFNINLTAGFKAQLWMLAEQARLEVRAEREIEKWERKMEPTWFYQLPRDIKDVWNRVDGIILCDRSIWDYLVYSISLNRRDKMTDKELDVIYNMVHRYHEILAPYDLIYLCKPRPLYDDGVRDLNPEWQQEIFEIFQEVIKENNLRVIPVDEMKVGPVNL